MNNKINYSSVYYEILMSKNYFAANIKNTSVYVMHYCKLYATWCLATYRVLYYHLLIRPIYLYSDISNE